MPDERIPLTLIYVDDEPLVLRVTMRRIEKRYGDRVERLEFQDPSAALERLHLVMSGINSGSASAEYARIAILSDGEMPSMTGVAFLSAACEILSAPILVGACLYSGTPDLIKRAREEKFDTALKPDIDSVFNFIDRCLALMET
ncbi:MAG: hypothetical protein WC787_03790 [Patescibacteria group bacterium]|jgi:hypothetical protein